MKSLHMFLLTWSTLYCVIALLIMISHFVRVSVYCNMRNTRIIIMFKGTSVNYNETLCLYYLSRRPQWLTQQALNFEIRFISTMKSV